MYKFNPKARHRARRFALQALYQWQLTADDVADIEAQFLLDPHLLKADVPYFRELIREIPLVVSQLDAAFTPFLDRELHELDPVELAVMRIGVYELTYRLEIPYRVIINEALELTKTFGAEDSYKYVNGILDKAAHQLRSNEIQSK